LAELSGKKKTDNKLNSSQTLFTHSLRHKNKPKIVLYQGLF
jgi:hypothetical protein